MALTDFVKVEGPTSRELVKMEGKVLVKPCQVRSADAVIGDNSEVTSWNYLTSVKWPSFAVAVIDNDDFGVLGHSRVSIPRENCRSYWDVIDFFTEKVLHYWKDEQILERRYGDPSNEIRLQGVVLGPEKIIPENIAQKLKEGGIEDICVRLTESESFDITLDVSNGVLYKVEYCGRDCLGVYQAEFEDV